MDEKSTDLSSRVVCAVQHPRDLPRKLGARVHAHLVAPLLPLLRKGNIAMFHVGRSGSTVFADLLGQHPGIFWDAEIYEGIFQEWEQSGIEIGTSELSVVDPVEYVRQRMRLAGSKFYGFEVKFFHLRILNTELADYVKSLPDLGFTHYIVLERKNYLRKIVSSVIAHQISRWHQADRESAVSSIVLDVDNVQIDRDAKPLMAYLQDYSEKFRALERLLDGQRVLRLTYEDDVSGDPLVGYQRACNFLGIDPHEVSVRLGKTNPFKLTEIIANLDQVEQTLSGTRYEWMLYG